MFFGNVYTYTRYCLLKIKDIDINIANVCSVLLCHSQERTVPLIPTMQHMLLSTNKGRKKVHNFVFTQVYSIYSIILKVHTHNTMMNELDIDK